MEKGDRSARFEKMPFPGPGLPGIFPGIARGMPGGAKVLPCGQTMRKFRMVWPLTEVKGSVTPCGSQRAELSGEASLRGHGAEPCGWRSRNSPNGCVHCLWI
jgi:hypothetical protein